MEERWSYVCNGTLEGQEKFAQRFLDEAAVREQPAGTYLCRHPLSEFSAITFKVEAYIFFSELIVSLSSFTRPETCLLYTSILSGK